MMRSILSVLVVLELAAACGSRVPADLTAEETPEADVTVQVVSRNFTDVVVYLYAGLARRRLGNAIGNQTTVFKVPWRDVGRSSTFHLLADSIGGDSELTSDHIELTPGAVVQWTLDAGLRRSNVNVY